MKDHNEGRSSVRRVVANTLAAVLLMSFQVSFAQKLLINDSGYFEQPGVNLLVFTNQYNGMFYDEKTAGIELIHYGVRTVTGGAIRLQNTPEQWDLIPVLVSRKVDKATNSIEAVLKYKEYDFVSRVVVSSKDKGVEISVYLDNPLPEKLEGKAGFNLEFLPAAYFEKNYLADGKPGSFPLYPASATRMEPLSKKIPQFAGHTTFDDRGRNEFIVPLPLATGRSLVLAPDDPERTVSIRSTDTDLQLFDGRNLGQNGWFIVRSLLPAGKTGKVLSWYLEPNAIPGWKRKPVIEFSQVGYRPEQEKTAVIELDKNDAPLTSASLYQVQADGKTIEKLKTNIRSWGRYLRYNYLKFDFSSVKEPGLYFIQYGQQQTNTFRISQDIYADIWHPTLDVWFPVQMDHMEVNEAYRVWHGVPFLDDALQAPVNHQHFDGYSMGPSTQTKYKPLERIPGLATGGWFDAGDFDIQTGSHCDAVLALVDAWEKFSLSRDETFIDYPTRYVDIHRPDGKPDILQQIRHGVLNMVAQVKNIGHPVRGIVVPNLHQYHHLGDASTETDNLPYNPSLKPFETDGKTSGTMDDRWAFTERSSSLDYYTAAALAAASRALKGFDDTLAEQSLFYAKKLWNENDSLSKTDTSRFAAMFRRNQKTTAALQLFITTKDASYAKEFQASIWQALDRSVQFGMLTALQACAYMDEAYRSKLKEYAVKYKTLSDGYTAQNPYGVPMATGGWGGNGGIVNWAITCYYVNKVFPDVMDAGYVYKGLDYIFGCHPYSNISFVSAVGERSKKITYGNNRADFSYIAGGVVPGILILKPDFPENKEDWPFFWGENEVTVGICANYIFLAAAAEAMSAGHQAQNPIIFADVPDISMLRVGDTYYMSSTTMHMNPGLPIMRSKDLVNWKLVSYAYDTLAHIDELDLKNGKSIYGRGSWASSLRYHDGTFYASTFAQTTGKTYIYSTKDIEKGPWKCVSFKPSYHDHSLFFDDDGRVYLLTGAGKLRLIELNADASGVKPGGLDQVVIDNASAPSGSNGGLPAEGSQLFKINGKYYLFNITWPRGGMRTVVIHRADKISGPYEGRIGLQDMGVAQGGLIQATDSSWYAYLFRDFGSVGRVPYLVPVKWEDGWPVLGIDGKIPETLDLPASRGLIPGIVASDEFSRHKGDPALPLVWQWNHNPDNTLWSVTERKGYLRLKTGRIDTSFVLARNTLTQRTIGPVCSGITSVDISGMKDGDFAGLALLQKKYGLIGVRCDSGRRSVVMVSAESGKAMDIQSVPLTDSKVYFKAECDFRDKKDIAGFYYSPDGKSWISIGQPLHMAYTIPHFMGYRFGLFNYSTKTAGGYADFDFFHITDEITKADK